MVSKQNQASRKQLQAFTREVGKLDELIEEIRDGLSGVNRSYKKAQVIAHSLRGISGLLKLPSLRRLSERAEAEIQELIQGNLSLRKERLHRLMEISQAILSVCKHLEEYGEEGDADFEHLARSSGGQNSKA